MLFNDYDLSVWYPIQPVKAMTCPDWIKNIKDIKICTQHTINDFCIIGIDSDAQTLAVCPAFTSNEDSVSVQCITDPAEAYKYKSYALLAAPLVDTMSFDNRLYHINRTCIHIEIIGPSWVCPGGPEQSGIILVDGYNVSVSGDSSRINIYGGTGTGLGVFPTSNIEYKDSTGLRSINGLTDAVHINSRSSDLGCNTSGSSSGSDATVTITLSLSANAYDT